MTYFVGSAALNCAFVAAGHSDVYCQAGIHCWDMAAGALIIKEAGGEVLDPSGEDFDLMSRGILAASTPDLIKDWLKQVDFKIGEHKRDFPATHLVL